MGPVWASASAESNRAMTRIDRTPDGSKVLIIEPEADDQCELCGEIAELRPYGPNGERICFDCGMKDEAGTVKRFEALLKPDN